MGKTIQAISVLVTHRDDDMAFVFDGSEEAKVAAAAKAVKDAEAAAKAAARPRISLRPMAPPPLAATSTPAAAPTAAPVVEARGVGDSSMMHVHHPGGGCCGGSEAAGDKPQMEEGTWVVAKGGKKVKGGTKGAATKEPAAHPLPPPPDASAGAASLPLPAPGAEPDEAGAAAKAAAPASTLSCPHVKPGKKVAPGTRCQECLRDQAPQAQIQARADFILVGKWSNRIVP